MIKVFSPIADTSPDMDCPACNGEGVDLDPHGRFDFEVIGACPQCWSEHPISVEAALLAILDAATAGATERGGKGDE